MFLANKFIMLTKNPFRIFLLLMFIFFTCTFSQEKNKPIIMAHFMPWFQTPSGHGYWGYHWTMNHFDPNKIDATGKREIASHYYPLTGPYDSNDKYILEYQTLLMKISGIDGVLVDWYGIENFWDYGTLNYSTQELFKAVKKSNLLFGIVYEDQSVKHMVENNKLTAANAIQHAKSVMQYLKTNWFDSDNYIKIDGVPILLTFGPQYFMTSGEWESIFSVLPLSPLFFTLDNKLGNVAAGAYPWPPMWKSNSTGVLTTTALNEYLNQFYSLSKTWQHTVTGAFTGFNDIYKEAGVGSGYGYLDALNGETFSSTLTKAIQSNAEVIQLVTWNDYGEGTMIEPTEEFGYEFLKRTQTQKRELDSTFSFRQIDLDLPLRIFKMRNEFYNRSDIQAALDKVFGLIINNNSDKATLVLDSLQTATSVQNNIEVPTCFYLNQNYPNPFNPETIIQFEVGVESKVKLEIFDMLGQKVKTLVNGVKSPGKYFVTWNINDVGIPSGIYLYKFQANEFVRTKKMILLK